jgi:Tol biopolymer transport system component
MKCHLPRQTLWVVACAGALLRDTSWATPPIEAVSLAAPGLPQSQSAQGDTFGLAATPDGAYVLFLSTAGNLATNHSTAGWLDLFLGCRTNATVRLVSVSADGVTGGDAHTREAEVTPDGRYVVFQSDAANLVTNDLNRVSDIFVRDMVAGTTTLLSINQSGTSSGNGASSTPAMTPDGRFVAFVSTANDLVADDTNGIPDVFVRDLQTAVTTLVSVGAQPVTRARPYAVVGSPVMTPDGRFIAFSSTASNLVTSPRPVAQEIYVRDLATGRTTWASTNVAPTAGPASYGPMLSDDGRYVAFKTAAGGSFRVLRRDLQTGQLDLVSASAAGLDASTPDDYGPVMTPDGRFIAFADNLTTAGTNAIWRWDAQDQTARLVSVNLLDQPSTNGLCDSPRITPDGRYVSFLSTGTDLVTNAVRGGFEAYVRDLQSGTTVLASADPQGTGAGRLALAPVLSGDGGVVTFESASDALVPNDLNRGYDLFVRDLPLEATELVSVAGPLVPPVTAHGPSQIAGSPVSADGRYVVFQSLASDLVLADTNGVMDIVVRDRVAATNVLVNVSRFGVVPTNGAARSPSISADGRFVVFLSTSEDLVTNDGNRLEDVFVRDLVAGTTTLVSVGTTGASGNRASTAASISGAGRWVAFQSQASNLTPGDADVADDIFVRDLVDGTTLLVSQNRSGDPTTTSFSNPLISPDGRFVAYQSSGTGAAVLRVADLTGGTTVLLAASATALAFSGNSQVLAAVCGGGGTASYQLLVADLVLGSQTTLALGLAAPSSNQGLSLSHDGRFVAFSSAGPLVGNDANGREDVFLYDVATANLTLISVNAAGSGAGNGRSFWPAISREGRYVAFRGLASDLVSDDLNSAGDLFLFDRLTGQNQALSHPWGGISTANGHSLALAMASGTNLLVFNSAAGDLVPGDFNRSLDVFAVGVDQADPTNQPPALRLTGVSASEAATTLAWTPAPGWGYRVQYKDALEEPTWRELTGPVRIAGSAAMFADAPPAGLPRRFYRLVMVP